MSDRRHFAPQHKLNFRYTVGTGIVEIISFILFVWKLCMQQQRLLAISLNKMWYYWNPMSCVANKSEIGLLIIWVSHAITSFRKLIINFTDNPN